MQPTLDDLVGYDAELAMSPARRQRFHEQLAGIPADPLKVPAGLAPFMRLPAPEPATLVRARMAETIARLVSANGNVTRDELLAAGFEPAELAAHFTAARRIARVDRMAV